MGCVLCWCEVFVFGESGFVVCVVGVVCVYSVFGVCWNGVDEVGHSNLVVF